MLFDQCIVELLRSNSVYGCGIGFKPTLTCNSGLNVRNLKKEILGLVQAHSFPFIIVGHQLKNGDPRWI